MVNITDVAESILEECGPMNPMKLQSLCYYCKAWSLVWEVELFDNPIKAWRRGPIIPELYAKHRNTYMMESGFFGGRKNELPKDVMETIQGVTKYYGDSSGAELRALAQLETPWNKARENIEPTEQSTPEITTKSMRDYFSNLK